MHYPPHLLKLIEIFKHLPGVGYRSAERFAFDLLTWPKEDLVEFAEAMLQVKVKLQNCSVCGCLIGEKECPFCDLSMRDEHAMCILASSKEVFAIEETREYRGLYHVLGGLLSPIDRKGPDHLSFSQLQARLQQLKVREIVIALDSTLEGDATALFLKQELANYPASISRIAFGLPMGSSLDYVDGGTLARALSGRQQF